MIILDFIVILKSFWCLVNNFDMLKQAIEQLKIYKAKS